MASATLSVANASLQKGFSDFSGLKGSSLPFSKKAASPDDFLSVVAFKTSAAGYSCSHRYTSKGEGWTWMKFSGVSYSSSL